MAKVSAIFTFALPFDIGSTIDNKEVIVPLQNGMIKIVYIGKATVKLEFPLITGEKFVADYFHSSQIEAEVQLEVNKTREEIFNSKDEGYKKEFFELTARYVNLFLMLCREITNNYKIKPLPLEVTDRSLVCIDDTPVVCVWVIDSTAMQEVTQTGGGRASQYKELDDALWVQIENALKHNREIDLVKQFLLDAEAVVHEDIPKEAVINSAIACELFIKKYVNNKIADLNDPIFKLLTSKDLDVSIFRYFHEILLYVTRHSLKDENPDLYDEIENLFKTRNNIAHKGACEFKTKDGRKIIKVDSAKAIIFIKKVYEFIDWIEALK